MTRIVILPGLDGDASLRAPLAKALGGAVTVIGYPPDISRISDMADHVDPLLPDEDFVIVAESYGGPVAINLAARQPKGLKGVVFVVTFAKPPRFVPGFLLPLIRRLPVRSPRGHRLMFRVTGWPWISASLIENFVSVAMALPAVTIRERLHSVLTTDSRADLAKITVPTAYLQAKSDRLVPRWRARDFAKAGAQVSRIRGSHYLLEESPDEAAPVLWDLIGQMIRDV
jgi:pimeloyl-[acyl-carrier protein] methyl ester esterase